MNETKRDSDSAKEEIEIDLRKTIKILRKRITLIILITLLTTLASSMFSVYYLKPVYRTQTLLLVIVASDKLVDNSQQAGQKSGLVPVLTMNTYLGQLKSTTVMKRVATALNLSNQAIGSLNWNVDASIIPDSNLINVTVTSGDPQLAANVANIVATEYKNLMKELMFSPIIVVSPASVPSAPSGPNVQNNISIAFISGLMLSILLAFLLEYTDNKLKTAEDIRNKLDLPVLGLIPIETPKNTRQTSYGGII
ncbi:MAG TPA: Wzz/FepE/Etk N-terminal domain-containing protein [Syntrophomonadaceae bacterium]|nr:Wzz/FepE/Etk N-terminal domain-containing protein [Syntrophomonadaceae bacterium]